MPASEPPAGYDATGTQHTQSAPAPAAGTLAGGADTTEGTTAAGAAIAAGTTKPPFYRRKWFIVCQIVTAIIGIVIIFVLLFPVVRAIAQSIVNKSQLNIETAAIVGPQNTTLVCR